MKKSKFSESQIVKILKEYESGTPPQELCRKHGISSSTFYHWRSKYSGMSSSELQGLKALEAENTRLKKMFADLSLEHTILKEVLEKKL